MTSAASPARLVRAAPVPPPRGAGASGEGCSKGAASLFLGAAAHNSTPPRAGQALPGQARGSGATAVPDLIRALCLVTGRPGFGPRQAGGVEMISLPSSAGLAAQGPTAGGRCNGGGRRFMVPETSIGVPFPHVAKAPARGAVGPCAAARRARLKSARPGQAGGGAQ